MIKINLNRTRVPNGSGGGDANDDLTGMQDLSMGGAEMNGRDIFVKIFIMLVGVVALALYQKQNIDALDATLAIATGETSKLQTELDLKKKELEGLKDIEPQAQALRDKLKVLRELSKLRLFQLQSLDYVQSIIPEKVWLQSMTYESSSYKIIGFAVETADLSDFVHKLEGSAYFQDVVVVTDREKPIQGGKIRDWELHSRSEVKN